MITPLKCISSVIGLLQQKKFSDLSVKNNLEIVASTTKIVLN
jgi:hypothetical protein